MRMQGTHVTGRTGKGLVAILAVLCLAAVQGYAQASDGPGMGQAAAPGIREGTPLPPGTKIGIEEKLGNMLPLQLEVYDERGYKVALKDVVKHPTVLTFVYFRCPYICSPLLNDLSRVVEQLDLEPNRDYQIVTLSFDAREKPELAAEKKQGYLNALKRKIDPDGWRFLTADSATIQQLTDAAGFYFARDGNDFVHAGALIVISPEGKVTRYINGIQYLPFDVKMAVMEAAEGRTGPTIAKLLKFCYRYDPEARTYAMDITRVSGIVILGLAALFVGVFIFRPHKKTVER
jgi:protein SCO1/2